MVEFTDEEMKMLNTIFCENYVYENVDYQDENCPWRALYTKVMEYIPESKDEE